MKVLLPLSLGILVVTLACQPECAGVREQQWSESGDVLVVENCVAGVWDDESAWRIVKELRIGSGSGADPDLFSRIESVAADSKGRIYVSDRNPDRVEVFSQDGSHLGTIGGSGDGPGEFRWAVGLATDDADRLWVIDYGLQRYTVFDAEGDLLLTAPREVGSWWMPWPGRLEGDRLFEVQDASDLSESRIRVLDANLTLLETIPLPIAEWGLVPFGPDPLIALGPGGVTWSGRTDPYFLLRRDQSGESVLALTRPVTGESLTRRERREAVDRFTGRQQQVAALAGEEGASSASTGISDIPRHQPVLMAIWIDETGFLWAGLRGGGVDDGSAYDVFDEQGVYQGELTLPFRVKVGTLPYFRGGHMYAVVTDDMNQESVVRARIVRPKAMTPWGLATSGRDRHSSGCG